MPESATASLIPTCRWREVEGVFDAPLHRHAKAAVFEEKAKLLRDLAAREGRSEAFDARNHPYHVRVGDWVREHRGIYRLAYFPLPERPDLIPRP